MGRWGTMSSAREAESLSKINVSRVALKNNKNLWKKCERRIFFIRELIRGERIRASRERIRIAQSLSGMPESLSGAKGLSEYALPTRERIREAPESVSGARRRRELIRCTEATNCENRQPLSHENAFSHTPPRAYPVKFWENRRIGSRSFSE